MPKIILLGDSIFDNAAYVGGGPDVVTHLQQVLPPDWSAMLLAVDGSVTSDVHRQLARIPRDATHLVVSAGGNDALAHMDFLEQPARSVAEVLDRLAEMRSAFDLEYRRLIGGLVERALPLTLCTIYEGALPDPLLQRRAATALTLFNDAILRVAFEQRLSLIDLRLVCARPEDYANPIEPSVQGGRRIATAIATATAGDPSRGATVYV